MKTPQDVILQPIVSEKSYDRMGEKIYQFRVAKSANKNQIKDAVEALFKVRVEQVNTVNVHPKAKRRGTTTGFTSSWKKAVVKLNPADSISFFEGIA
ncbi:MAG TPA: 50S ribosomal protein L23 [Candidatus Ozemobacteraceae bacterium]|nr:50S ribosomal protein L23 [Candidatus Ozemobacteraceae bacterium]